MYIINLLILCIINNTNIWLFYITSNADMLRKINEDKKKNISNWIHIDCSNLNWNK